MFKTKKMRKSLGLVLAVTVLATMFLSGCRKTTEQDGTQSQGGNNTASSGAKNTDNGNTNKPVDNGGKNPIVTIEMEDGSKIKIELYPNVAPNTVRNFISLTEKGFYNGLIFHRVIPGFMIQGGDPKGNGTGGPNYSIKGEFSKNNFKNDLKHERGVISMARGQQANSAGSQFFIMVDKADYLDGQYAAFGKVIEGMETVDKIVKQPVNDQDKPLKEQKMKTVTVETFGFNYGEVEKVK